ncbi:MAG TPA: DUF6512 family protein [Candidatus Deferrimicrobium sp.]|nr:DUF6512 family protein [Candidatus Deferrimicrobium sp.]
MPRKSVLIWELSGIVFLIVVGSLLHFTFDWSNRLPLVGLLSPVNESVWEHLKLGFWSLVLFSSIEYWFIRHETNNFLLAKGLGVVILQVVILSVFYTYTMFSGEPILAIDISSYILGCVLCQVVSYIILTRVSGKKLLNNVGLALIIIHAVLLIAFTFAPPRLPIFQDSHTLTYGIR